MGEDKKQFSKKKGAVGIGAVICLTISMFFVIRGVRKAMLPLKVVLQSDIIFQYQSDPKKVSLEELTDVILNKDQSVYDSVVSVDGVDVSTPTSTTMKSSEAPEFINDSGYDVSVLERSIIVSSLLDDTFQPYSYEYENLGTRTLYIDASGTVSDYYSGVGFETVSKIYSNTNRTANGSIKVKKNGKTEDIPFTYSVVDSKAPEIKGPDVVWTHVGLVPDYQSHFSSYEANDGDLRITIQGAIDYTTVGNYSMRAISVDLFGNKTVFPFEVKVGVDAPSDTIHPELVFNYPIIMKQGEVIDVDDVLNIEASKLGEKDVSLTTAPTDEAVTMIVSNNRSYLTFDDLYFTTQEGCLQASDPNDGSVYGLRLGVSCQLFKRGGYGLSIINGAGFILEHLCNLIQLPLHLRLMA